jgi:DNA helicase-2/ATP-dependent DNA helicase PcrA
MTERDLVDYTEAGREEIKKYLESYKWSRAIWNEYKVTGVPLNVGADEIRLTGNLDKIEMLGGNRVNVIDYKTGKPKSRNFIEGNTKDADGNYKRQLVFYKLLLDRYKNGEWQMETGTIDFIKPSDSGKLQREVFTITDAEVALLESLIIKTAKEIMSFSFADSNCMDGKCEWCRLHKTITV